MPLHYCPECQNILIFAQDGSNLIARCRICGYSGASQTTILSTKTYQKSQVKQNQTNSDVIYDNTLERTIHYTCPNQDCITHKNNSKKEAVFTRDSEINLQRAMVCVECQTKWRI